ncbi:DUF742 domain-containing protein [Streptomyces sp. NPDC002004]
MTREQPPPQERRAPQPQNEEDPNRLFVIGGANGDARTSLDLVTLIVAKGAPSPGAQPEQAALIGMCRTPLSVAELSAYLRLPFSVVSLLLSELIAVEKVQARAPIVPTVRVPRPKGTPSRAKAATVPERSLLEAVMHGLQRL